VGTRPVIGRPAAQRTGRCVDDLHRGRAVLREQPQKHAAPLLGGRRGEFLLRRLVAARRIREPHVSPEWATAHQDEVIAERLAPLYGGHAEHLHAVLQRRSPEELRVIADFLRDMTRPGQ